LILACALPCSALPLKNVKQLFIPAHFAQQGTNLVGTDGLGAYQGFSVTLSADGNTAIVGGPCDKGNAGAAWVYTFSTSSGWTQQAKLFATDAVGLAGQGSSVALSADGNTAIEGGPFDNGNAGAAWVFTRSGNTWKRSAKLVGTNAIGHTYQGSSVALSVDGNTALVGGPCDNSNAGAAWVFRRSLVLPRHVLWNQVKLFATDAVGPAMQGYSVALSADGNTAIVGGPNDNSITALPDDGPVNDVIKGDAAGAAWVFTFSANRGWTQRGKLAGDAASLPQLGTSLPQLGTSVALSADGRTAIVGGPNDNNAGGAAWVFTLAPITLPTPGVKFIQFIPQGKLFGNCAAFVRGWSVALSGDGKTALVGAPSLISANSAVGAACVFTCSTKTVSNQPVFEWTQMGNALVGNDPSLGSWIEQGWSVALSADGKTAIVGGPSDGSDGAAWVYRWVPAWPPHPPLP
jgi:hypothetical protein